MEFEKAKEIAIKYIGISKKTEKEVITKLKGKGISPLTIEKVIEYLKELEYIDDEKYTIAYFNTCIKLEQYFIYEITQKLLQKGIKASIIEDVKKRLSNDLELYNEKVKEKLFKYKLKDYDEEKRRAYLYRRGYNQR